MSDINGEILDLENELRAEQDSLRLTEAQVRNHRARVEGLRARILSLKEARSYQEQSRLASYPIADRDGYESAELAMKDRRAAEASGQME